MQVIFLSLLLLPCLVRTEDYPNVQLLIEPDHLAKLDNVKRFHILDARDKASYQAGHIPGALWVSASDWAKQFQDGKDVPGWSKRLGELGLTPDSRVVIYDDNKTKDAARVWWILKYWGVKDARLLNGMWTGWKNGKHPISQDGVTPTTTDFQSHPERTRLATKQDVLDSLERSAQIVDSRTTAEYTGQQKLNNKRAGCIPGAKHLDWENLVDAQTQRFKSAGEIKKLINEAGFDLASPLTAHCQSGGRSSVMSFVLELMGAQNVRNYHASWSEWGNSDDTPIVMPKK